MATRNRIREGDGDPRHGSLNGYINSRCRCQPCRDAQAAYQRAYRGVIVLSRDDPRHGTTNGYQNYGCRCRNCRTAQADAWRDYRRIKAGAA